MDPGRGSGIADRGAPGAASSVTARTSRPEPAPAVLHRNAPWRCGHGRNGGRDAHAAPQAAPGVCWRQELAQPPPSFT